MQKKKCFQHVLLNILDGTCSKHNVLVYFVIHTSFSKQLLRNEIINSSQLFFSWAHDVVVIIFLPPPLTPESAAAEAGSCCSSKSPIIYI